MSSIQIAGDTSGSITLSAPAVAGTNTITLPAVTGTILTTAYTGNVTFSGDLTVDTDTLYVDAANNRVGIGTTTPEQKVEIVGSLGTTYSNTTLPTSGGGSVVVIDNTDTSASSNSSILFRGADAGGTLRHGAAITWGKSGAWTAGGGNYGSYLTFYTRVDGGAALERMRIDSAGNVGIGTSSPASKLSIVAATGNGLNVTTSSSNAADAIIVTATNSSLVNLTSVGRPSDNASKIRFVNSAFSAETAAITELGGGGNLAINTAGTERMRINSTGNVGIGTSSPNAKLEVYGQRIRINSASDPGIELANTTDVKGYLFYDTSGSDVVTLRHASTGTGISVNSSGNVGIGTTSPTQKLDVNGTVNATAFTGDGSALTGVGNETITLSGDLSGSGTTSINAQLGANVVNANELNVTGNGTTSQFLRSDGDGSFTWASPSTNPYTAQALNSNGYIKFVGGMILQWGAVAVNSNSTTSVSFPTSFPTACRQVVVTTATTENTAYVNGGAVTGFSTTAFTLFIFYKASTWRWFAVGY